MIQDLSPAQALAAIALGQGKTHEEAATAADVKRATVERWLKQPAFKATVDAEAQRIRDAIRAEGIANRQNRIDALNRRQQLMDQVIAERAVDPTMQNIAGGKTGLMVRSFRGVGKGEDFTLVEEYTVDTGLLKEMREHEKQAAQDLGQWTEKREVAGDPDKPLHLKHATTFNYDTYTALLTEVLSGGPGRLDAASADGVSESVDTASPD